MHVQATLCGIALAVWTGIAFADTQHAFPPPEGDVILTVSGNIDVRNAGDVAEFDIAMLQEFEPVVFSTSTIWTNGISEFTGVSLHAFLTSIGAEGDMIRATAINDYMVEIPVSDAVEGGPIIAYYLDGSEMSVREKGPLWIVYPFDSHPEYQTEVIYTRAIWQLDRIEIVSE